jgi:hypothetical protein
MVRVKSGWAKPDFVSPRWPGLENILPELKTVLPDACLRRGFRLRQGSGGQVGRQADFVIEGYVDPTEPLRDEGPFGDHTGPSEVRSLRCEVRRNSDSGSSSVWHSSFGIPLIPSSTSQPSRTAKGFWRLVACRAMKSSAMKLLERITVEPGKCGA